MAKKMDEYIEYVLKSKNRLAVLQALGRTITTTNKVAASTRLQASTVRPIINGLVKKGLVKEAVKKKRPMIYETTSLGSAVLSMQDAKGNMKWKGSSRQKRIARRIR